eukprot:546231-Rhodomonas_salina.1
MTTTTSRNCYLLVGRKEIVTSPGTSPNNLAAGEIPPAALGVPASVNLKLAKSVGDHQFGDTEYSDCAQCVKVKTVRGGTLGEGVASEL